MGGSSEHLNTPATPHTCMCYLVYLHFLQRFDGVSLSGQLSINLYKYNTMYLLLQFGFPRIYRPMVALKSYSQNYYEISFRSVLSRSATRLV